MLLSAPTRILDMHLGSGSGNMARILDPCLLRVNPSPDLNPGSTTAFPLFVALFVGGTGDYETVHSIVRHFGRGCDGIPCRRPMGIKVVSVHGKSPDQEGEYHRGVPYRLRWHILQTARGYQGCVCARQVSRTGG